MTPAYPAVRACCIALLAGYVLHAGDITAGKGKVVDWRTVKSGEELQTGTDAFDTAYLFVTLVGPEAALASLVEAPTEAPSVEDPPPEIVAFAPGRNGCRLRQFEVGVLPVRVEVCDWLDGDDIEAAAFAEALALAAHDIAKQLTTRTEP